MRMLCPSSSMTNSNVYYYVWNGTVTDPSKLDPNKLCKKIFYRFRLWSQHNQILVQIILYPERFGK